MRQRFNLLIRNNWQQWLLYTILVLAIGGTLWYRLGTLVPGFSIPELLARAHANTASQLVQNPLFLPHKILQYGLLRLHLSGAFWMRSVSAIFGLAILVAYYDIIRSWYSRRIALLASILFLTSAWFLHFARLATPDILFASSIGIVWVGMKLRSANAPRIRVILASVIILLICLYVPGLPWIVLPLLIWQRKLIREELKKTPGWLRFLTYTAVLVGLAPLVYGLARTPLLVRSWLYLPASLTPEVWLSNLWHLPLWLAIRGPELPVYWLGRMPSFDVFSLVMLLLGIFVLNYYRLLDRVRAITLIVSLSLALAIFNGWVALTIALPLFYVLIAAGIALFLQQWFTVFPKNPLARSVGIGLVVFVIVVACNFNIHHYFVAWPRNSDTKQVFSLHG